MAKMSSVLRAVERRISFKTPTLMSALVASRLLRSQPDADGQAVTCAGSASGDLAKIVAVVENDPHAGTQRPGIPAQRRNLVDVKVTVLDLAHPAR